MPLRDHFRPPIWNLSSWEGLHGMWPATMVQELVPQLPAEYTAEPRVHLGSYFEIDVCAYEHDEQSKTKVSGTAGAAQAVSAPPQPTFAIDAELTDQYEYEVLIYDQSRAQLVAAVEICSPANKDRLDNRRAFVATCAALLQKKVCVSIVDIVTTRHFNLYADLLDLFGQSDPAFASSVPAVYAATCRGRRVGNKPRFETWAYPLIVGQPLPTLPIWLTDDLSVSLNLEASYEAACGVLRIP
jgi:hypothetical protein